MNRTSKYQLALSISLISFLAAQRAGAQNEGEYQVQPVFSRYAATQKNWFTLNTTARVFNDVTLQEAVGFDGWGIDADVTVRIPWTERWQVRLFWPIYTEGHARLTAPDLPDTGGRIRIDGYTGIYDYPNLQLEYQFLKNTNSQVNASVYGGYGERQRTLDTTTFARDKYNHAGQYVLFGLRSDWRHGDDWRFVVNAGGRYYMKSDDINPGGEFDEYAWADISGAAIYHPWKAPIFPMVELVYQGDFIDYNSLLIVPEVVLATCKNFEVKVAGEFGLTSDGENVGGRVQGTLRF